GFHFGLVGDEFTSTRKDLEPPATDAEGKTTIALNLTDLPDVTKPLAVTVQVSVFEPSGRAVIASVMRPIRQPPLAIGLRSPAGEARPGVALHRDLAGGPFSVPDGGMAMELPVDAARATRVHALVSASRLQAAAPPAAGPAAPRGPGRAVGVAWLGVDASPRTLSVALSAPDVVRPRGPAEIGVKVAGLAANEDPDVALCAVDEGVLKLTECDR